jgi:regulator of protease activity HflC (stomatin/prohibitin superfamily)
VAAVLVLILASSSVTVVDPGHRGVRITLGKVSRAPLEEGLHFKVPLIQRIEQLDVRTLRWAEVTQAYTQDVQQAKQKVISAQAEAESIRIRTNALGANPRLVEWEAVQKWDGKLPQYQLGGATPFINISPR